MIFSSNSIVHELFGPKFRLFLIIGPSLGLFLLPVFCRFAYFCFGSPVSSKPATPCCPDVAGSFARTMLSALEGQCQTPPTQLVLWRCKVFHGSKRRTLEGYPNHWWWSQWSPPSAVRPNQMEVDKVPCSFTAAPRFVAWPVVWALCESRCLPLARGRRALSRQISRRQGLGTGFCLECFFPVKKRCYIATVCSTGSLVSLMSQYALFCHVVVATRA